jgi:FkbM family methyltransferase
MKYYSQFGQDKWVLGQTCFKKDGYFIDIGAYDGIISSNTYVLEKYYGWRGICAEPGKINDELKKNRSCFIEEKLIFSDSGKKIKFLENNYQSGALDYLSEKYKNNMEFSEVESLTLFDLLKKFNAPKEIDYISIDTEGTEYEIIKDFPFKDYNIRLITIEHNKYTGNNNNAIKKQKIFNLLIKNGYKRVGHRFFSICFALYKHHIIYAEDIEDWYVLKSNYSFWNSIKYSIYLLAIPFYYFRYINFKTEHERLAGQIGLFLKKRFPKLYFCFKKIRIKIKCKENG